MDRRLVILAGLLAMPYIVSALMLVLYFQIDETVSRHFGILLTTEYQAPILWGAVPVLLLWIVDTGRGRWRLTGRITLTVFVVALGVTRATQTVSVVQTRYYLHHGIFQHVDMIEFVLTALNISVFLGILLPVLFLAGLLWTPGFPSTSRSHKLYTAILLGCLGLSWFASYRAEAKQYLEHFTGKHGIPHGAEVALFQLLCGHDNSYVEESATLSQETRDRLASFGVLVQPDSDRPFLRPRVYDPADKTPWQDFEQQPDVVLIFAESLSARLLDCYDGPESDVSPWIDKLADRSLKFENYFNHATPTVCGLHGSLTSNYEVSTYDTYADPDVKLLVGARTLSLAVILSERGYDTTYFGQGSPHETNLGEMMVNLGFGKQLFCYGLRSEFPATTKQFEKEYPDYIYTGHVSDILMCRYVQKFMARPSKRPRLLCVSTIGMHFPYDFGEGVHYGDGSKPILNSVHLLDRALSDTCDYLKGNSREVVFVLTADHAMFPTRELIEVREKEYSKFMYDRIALIINRSGHDKGVAIDTLSSSVDLLPTLMHLLGINIENPFMGWSIFSERRNYPRLLGSHDRHLFVKTAAGEWSPVLAKIDKMPDIPLGDGRMFTSSHFREWLAYLRYQIRHDRIW